MFGRANVMLLGRLTADPKLASTETGLAVLHFTIAVNRSFKSNGEVKKEVTFCPVAVFGASASTHSKNLAKGNPVLIEGVLRGKNGDLHVFAKEITYLNGSSKKNLDMSAQETTVIEENEEVVKEGAAA